MKRLIQPQFHSSSSLFAAALLGAAFLLPCRMVRADDNYALSLDPHWSEPASADVPAPDATNVQEESIPFLDAATLPSADTSAPPPKTDRLSLSFELPIWLSGMNGTVGARGLTVPANASFTQILDATDSVVGFGGRLEADYGHWIFFGSGLYMRLVKDNVGPGPINIKFVSELGIVDAGILYQVGRWNITGKGGAADPSIALAAHAAWPAHRTWVSSSNRSVGAINSWQSNEGLGRIRFWRGMSVLDLDGALTKKPSGGDVGGGSSDLTWSTGLFLGYRFNFCPKVLGCAKIGYEAVSEDFTSGSGSEKFTWDEILHGPLISRGHWSFTLCPCSRQQDDGSAEAWRGRWQGDVDDEAGDGAFFVGGGESGLFGEACWRRRGMSVSGEGQWGAVQVKGDVFGDVGGFDDDG